MSVSLWALLMGCGGLPPCEGYGQPEALGQLDDAEADEISGLAASAFHDGIYWAHEDESGGAEIIAVDAQAQLLGRWELTGPAAVDPEDIAVVEGRVLLGDLGDNTLSRDSLRILRVPEPDPSGGGGDIDSVEVFTVVLPDGPADVEAMLVDPISGDVLLIEKSGGDPRAWSVPLGEGGEPAVAALGRLPLGDLPGEAVVTGADVSPDGARVLLRTWEGVLIFERADGESAWDALNGAACLAPTAEERQGEAVAATADGFLTLSEGVGATLWRTLRAL